MYNHKERERNIVRSVAYIGDDLAICRHINEMLSLMKIPMFNYQLSLVGNFD